MLLQRARVAESRVKNRLANGPLRVQSNGAARVGFFRSLFQSILQRKDVR